MHIALMKGYDDVPANPVHAAAHNIPVGTPVKIDPYFTMFTATGSYQPGWLASQADMLATDWEIAG